MLRKKFRTAVDERASEFCYNEMSPVTAKATQGLFNYQCYFNAVEYATRHKDVKVIMGLYVENGKVVLHFWNKRGDTHLETSMGHRADGMTYYPIREIKESDWPAITVVFDDALIYYNNKFIKWYEKPFIERAV